MRTEKENIEQEKEALNDAMIDDIERRMGWDGDWSKVAEQYEGR